MSFEESLIRNAAPTLAGIKVASLFNYSFSSQDACEKTIATMNQSLNHKGVFIELMNHRDDFYLVYVYRKKQLYNLINSQEMSEFLRGYGYFGSNDTVLNTYSCIKTVKRRIQECDGFPHEIGIFLGYPLADVIGFIEQKGEGCALCGDWKVYGDVKKASYLFCKLKKCRDVYLRIYNDGRKLYDMTVSA